jgi:hypothetical protein
MIRQLKIERGRVVLKYNKKHKTWQAEVGGLDDSNRFLLEQEFETPGQALDASRRWAKQRKMSVWVTNATFQVLGDPPA